MSKQEKVNIEVKKTLNAFDKIEELPSNPFLYTRIQSRLNERNQAGSKKSLITAFKPALFLVLFIINVYTIFNVVESESPNNNGDAVNLFMQEYSLGESNYYSNNNF